MESRYEIKARQIAYEQRQSEMSLKGASEQFRAATGRVAERENLFHEAKARAAKPGKGTPLLELDRMNSSQKLLKAAKSKLNQSLVDLKDAAQTRDQYLKQVGELKTKGDFLAERIQTAEIRRNAKLEDSQGEELAQLGALKSTEKSVEPEEAIDTLSNVMDDTGDIDPTAVDSVVQVTYQPEIPSSTAATPELNVSASNTSKGDSTSFSDSSERSNSETPPAMEVWEDKGVVTAKFDVGERYKVELSAEGTGPVSVYISPQNGQELSPITILRIKEQLKAKNIEYAAVVVARGAR